MLDSQGVRLRLLRVAADARASSDEPSDALSVLLRRIDALADDLDVGLWDKDGATDGQ